MSANDFWKEIIFERVEQILREKNEEQKKCYKEQEIILKALDAETREIFERFAADLTLLSANEYQTIYWQAFMDGLNLGHQAF